ncbi:MAG: DciA family protein [bacterium]|nr:DciA family protein [bacterium]
MTHHIKQFLANITQSHSDWKTQLLHNWSQIIGTLHTKVTIEKIHQDTLVLGVYDSCWLQELYMLSPMLLKRINEQLDKPYLKHLQFKQARRIKKRTADTKQEKKSTLTTITLTSVEQKALAQLNDPELKEVMKAFLIRCYQER